MNSIAVQYRGILSPLDHNGVVSLDLHIAEFASFERCRLKYDPVSEMSTRVSGWVRGGGTGGTQVIGQWNTVIPPLRNSETRYPKKTEGGPCVVFMVVPHFRRGNVFLNFHYPGNKYDPS